MVAIRTKWHWYEKTEAPTKSGMLSHNRRNEYHSTCTFKSSPKHTNTRQLLYSWSQTIGIPTIRHHITESQVRISGYSSALTDLYTYKPVLGAPNDFIKPTYVFVRNSRIVIPNRNEWENNMAEVDYRSHVYFADGSKRKVNSGYGIHMANDGRDLIGQCGEYAEITHAEILAIENCCLYAIKANK